MHSINEYYILLLIVRANELPVYVLPGNVIFLCEIRGKK